MWTHIRLGLKVVVLNNTEFFFSLYSVKNMLHFPIRALGHVTLLLKVSKGEKIRNRYHQVPHPLPTSHLRLLSAADIAYIYNNMNPDQTASKGSSLIRIHSVSEADVKRRQQLQDKYFWRDKGLADTVSKYRWSYQFQL